MNIDRIINMVIRQIMRRFINKGVSVGIDAVSKKRTSGAPQNTGTMTQAEAEQAHVAKEAAKRARKAARLSRKL
jgi:hypothetical protein